MLRKKLKYLRTGLWCTRMNSLSCIQGGSPEYFRCSQCRALLLTSLLATCSSSGLSKTSAISLPPSPTLCLVGVICKVYYHSTIHYLRVVAAELGESEMQLGLEPTAAATSSTGQLQAVLSCGTLVVWGIWLRIGWGDASLADRMHRFFFWDFGRLRWLAQDWERQV